MPTYLEKIDAMQSLAKNWDSYGADPANPRTLQDAQSFLKNFIASVGLSDPQAVPTRVGGVCVLWILNGYELEMEFEPGEAETFVSFVFENESANETIKGEFRISSESEVYPAGLQALAKLFVDSGNRVAV